MLDIVPEYADLLGIPQDLNLVRVRGGRPSASDDHALGELNESSIINPQGAVK